MYTPSYAQTFVITQTDNRQIYGGLISKKLKEQFIARQPLMHPVYAADRLWSWYFTVSQSEWTNLQLVCFQIYDFQLPNDTARN